MAHQYGLCAEQGITKTHIYVCFFFEFYYELSWKCVSVTISPVALETSTHKYNLCAYSQAQRHTSHDVQTHIEMHAQTRTTIRVSKKY